MKPNYVDARQLLALSVVLFVGVLSAACWSESTASAESGVLLSGGRAYEQVSPRDKNGADLEPAPAMASIDGGRLLFVSRGSFAGQPSSLAAEGTPYLSTRGPGGWATEGIALPNAQLAFGSDGYQGFTPDMSKGIISWAEFTRAGPYDPAAQTGFNQYIRDSETGTFQLANGPRSSMANDEGFIWGSSTFDVVALSTFYSLTADSPCTPAEKKACAYESEQGVVRLASVLPDGTPVAGTVGNFQVEGNCNFERAMSADGSRLFFTSLTAVPNLYARQGGTSTSLVSGSERTQPGGAFGSGVNYQSAEAAHGDRVLFTTKNSLVDADTNSTNDLYLYDFTKPLGNRLTLVSEDHDPEAPEGASVTGGPEGCAGFVGASEDLRRVYFVADNQIVAGAPGGPGPKLYLWDDTGAAPALTYVATLDANDSRTWAAPAVAMRVQGIPRQARWSRDGRYLAFFSVAPLTGFDNEGEEELFRYDADSEVLECVTCEADALPAHGEVSFQPHAAVVKPVNHLPQNVSDSGQVFFQTTRGLVLRDSNGQRDVYEYDGQLHLISKGSGDGASGFLDATPSGSDVFFTTRDRLVGWDLDGAVDAYDARVGGGFPEPSFVPPPCEGEACLAAPQVPNDATPGSSSFNGPGNLKPAKTRPCPRGKVRRNGKCRKKRHSNNHHAKRSPSTRSHG